VRLDEAALLVERVAGSHPSSPVSDELRGWFGALRRARREHARDAGLDDEARAALDERLRSLAAAARSLAYGMDFGFLVDEERSLLSIGYDVSEHRLDESCYDLLASEARLASLFAIAKGDVETRHWFRLGRTARPVGTGSVLWSWTGSMFEYLMPALVMHAPAGSLLEQSQRRAVDRQRAYGRSLDVPWGVSESAYAARDLEFTYQYAPFGVPDLGLKRATLESLVVAPYATGLAAMVEPRRARRNFERLRDMGAMGPYGFYDALDFTRSRASDGARFTVVRTSMAHHQGMTIVGIANVLDGGRMRTRFHREPAIRAAELLLQERVPRDVIALRPTAPDISGAPFEAPAAAPVVRTITPSTDAVSATHLLSNGRYAVMLTSTGAGYSRWGDVAITRWRPDATRDDLGTLVFVRDTSDGAAWPVGHMPLNASAERASVAFAEDRATFKQRFGRLETTMDVLVSAEDDAEVRRVSLANTGRTAREIEVTSYAELVLTAPATDDAHPAFAKMFVQTEYLSEHGALIATRRRRSPDDRRGLGGAPRRGGGRPRRGAVVRDRSRALHRARRVDRGGSGHGAGRHAVRHGRHRARSHLRAAPPGARPRGHGRARRVLDHGRPDARRAARPDRPARDKSAFDRAKTLAWTQAQLQLRFLDVGTGDAADFQRLATPLLYPDARFRAPPGVLTHGAGAQAGLWPHAISGDLPIVLLRIDDVADLAQVRQLLSAHEYWRMKRLAVDVVIVNEHGSSYLQDLQSAIEAAVRSSQARPRSGERLAQGSVYTLRADLLSPEAYALLRSVARVALIAQRGPIRDQLARVTVAPTRAVAAPRTPRIAVPLAALALPAPAEAPAIAASSVRGPALADVAPQFANGTGGFSADGREYVTVLQGGATTPLPWINVISNQRFGFHVSAEGSGYTWSENSRDFQLTPWSNDPVVDPPGELIYVRDEGTGAVWNATAQGVRDGGTYVARHGFGYSRFEHEAHGVALDLVQFVPLDDPIKVSRLTLHNRSSVTKRLSVTAYGEWVLGTSRDASAPFLVTAHDEATGSLFVRNPWNGAYAGVVAFSALGAPPHAWTGDRTEFLGRGGRPSRPKALFSTSPMSRRVGAGLDPCTALQTLVELAPGERAEVVSFVGAASSQEEARALITRYRGADLDGALEDVRAHWRSVLGAITVRTPDAAMDVMLNGWLLYQTIACRLWARSAFYQASGAYGFRDQLQDGMALTFAMPDEARAHLLRAASRQFVEGDVQHWWLPSSGRGVRTRISDDRVWLAYAAAAYVERSADTGVLDEVVPFLEGPDLRPGEHDAFFEPREAFESGTLFEHCARGLDQAVALTGAHGLPLMGTGDWNDGMNRVGEGGRGESVWLGWLLVDTLERFSALTEARDPARVERWRAHAATVRAALEREAWDGAWYRRATFDDGTWLGTASGEACRIDSIAQTWAVLSGAAEPARAATAMASLAEHLVRPDDGLALLFTPPFDDGPLDPGYIKGYPPGLRENGGQYTHAAMWAILAYVRLGKGDEAVALFDLLNPINHARSPAEVKRYAVEPYVVAADVYSVAPHVGRGGWTWYTGSAAWMYRAGVEGVLGIRREAGDLVVDPCLPAAWPGFEATVRSGEANVTISVDNRAGDPSGGWAATLDGVALAPVGGVVRTRLDAGTHHLRLWRHSG
jgi:cyclic beta-1,2-glucan synthetase